MSRILYIQKCTEVQKSRAGFSLQRGIFVSSYSVCLFSAHSNTDTGGFIPLSFGPSVSDTEALPAQPGTVCSRSGFC